jgi:hypothetical protein
MIIESIQITGMDVYYVPRTLVPEDVNPIFLEDALASYEDAYRIEAYLDNAQGFDGDGAMMSKFGIQISDTCTFVIARSRWEQEIGMTGKTRLPRPIEGDLIYLPLTKSFFEIMKVDATNPFYQLGKLFTYKLECELFQYSHERITTGVDEIDELMNLSGADNENFSLDTDGDVVLEAEDGTVLSQEYNIQDYDTGAQNVDLEKRQNAVLSFDESNPFGEIQP